MPPRCPECGQLAEPHLRAGHGPGCVLGFLGALAWATHAPGWHLLWLTRLAEVLTEGNAADHAASPGPEVS